MKSRLIKQGDRYVLYAEGGHKIACTSDSPHKKLSLKNCQAIENGYDLDKLADEMLEKAQTPHKLMSPITYRDGVIKGFQKALELMGDKKFSEEDVISMIEKSRETGLTAQFLILTKQQTEWDVEVEMDILNEYDKPKLDTDGCLILKRV